MKGVRYLVDEAGNKTHAVLDLGLWQDALDALLVGAAPELPSERQPGFLTELLRGAGYTQQQLDEMNRSAAEEALRPLTPKELGLTDGL